MDTLQPLKVHSLAFTLGVVHFVDLKKTYSDIYPLLQYYTVYFHCPSPHSSVLSIHLSPLLITLKH